MTKFEEVERALRNEYRVVAGQNSYAFWVEVKRWWGWMRVGCFVCYYQNEKDRMRFERDKIIKDFETKLPIGTEIDLE